MSISPVAQKLHLKPEQSILILNAPGSFFILLGDLPENKIETANVSGHYDYVHLFVKDSIELEHHSSAALNSLGEDTLFWISYPKQTSKINTDLNRDKGWEPIFNAGYRPVSQVAIDENWSAVRFRKGIFSRTLPTGKTTRIIIVPDDFRLALSGQAGALQTFEKLAFTHRKEYIQWIEGAKKTETRERRMKLVVDKIAAGKKLN